MRAACLYSRAHTPLGTASHINPNRESFRPLTQPSYEQELLACQSSRPLITSTPRSPLIRLPSLYVQQMEYEQEQDQMAKGVFNGTYEEHVDHEIQRPDFNTGTYEENWYNRETKQEMSYKLEDLEHHRRIGDLDERGLHEADMYGSPLPVPEAAGFYYENAGLDVQTDGYRPQDVREDEYTHWNCRASQYEQEPWNEYQQDPRQQHVMNHHENQQVQSTFLGYRERDEDQDMHASEPIPTQRFWWPNPHY